MECFDIAWIGKGGNMMWSHPCCLGDAFWSKLSDKMPGLFWGDLVPSIAKLGNYVV